MRWRGAAAYFFPGLKDVLWIAVFAGVLALGPRLLNIDGDLGRHITIGRYILSTGTIPLRDLFSHTMAGQPLTPHEWLSQVLFALAYNLMGLNGVVLLAAGVIALAFWIVYRRALQQSRAVLMAAVATLLAIAASSLHWLARPHLFTFLLLALWVDALERLRCGYLNAWWKLPLLMLLWVNLHGAFIAGFVTWGIYGFGMAWDRFFRNDSYQAPDGFWRTYGIGGLAALLVTLANPAGLGVWSTSLGYLGNSYLVNHTAEYLPPDFHSPSTWPFLLMLALAFVSFGMVRRRPPAAHLFLTGAWTAMALYSVRNVPLFAIVSAAPLAAVWSEWLAENSARQAILRRLSQMQANILRIEAGLKGMALPAVAVGAAALAFTGGTTLDFNHSGNRFDPAVFPVAAVDWMEAHPLQGHGFNYFSWGGYLLYRLWPAQTVFIDGQTDFYGERLTREYEQVIMLQPGWQDVMKQDKINWVLVPPDSLLAQQLIQTSGWQVAYRDATAVLLVA